MEKALYGADTKPWTLPPNSLHAYRTFDAFNLLYLNTALFCNDDSDRGKLLIGSNCLFDTLEAVQQQNPDKPIIVLAHHGMDDFTTDEKRMVEQILKDYPILLYLCGDAHDPWARRVNDIPEITMGCLVYEKNVRPAFATGKLENGRFILEAHEWDARQLAWGPYAQFNNALNTWGKPKSISAHIVTLNMPAAPTPFLFGRDALLKHIESLLQGSMKITLLNGMGGIGKTEICRKLFHQYKEASLPTVKHLGWLTYQNNLKETFYGQFTEISMENMDADQYWRQTQRYIQKLGNALLLFIDNANTMTQREAAILSELPCKVILTSRKALEDIESVKVGTLPLEACRELYMNYSRGEAFDAAIDGIINLAARHTLAVKLLAKTQYESGKTAQEMLSCLQETGFTLCDIEEEIIHVHNPELDDAAQENAVFIAHMAKIFDLSTLKENKDGMRILKMMALLAPEPIALATIKKWFQLPNLNALNQVVKAGWLERGSVGGEETVFMHPIIAAVVRQGGVPCDADADMLYKNMAEELHLNHTDIFTDKLVYMPHCVAALTYMPAESAAYALLCHNVASMFHDQGNYAEALVWYQKALAIFEQVLGKDHPDTATTYNNIAGLYKRQGDYPKALEWHQKALTIRERVLGNEHPNTAISYNNIAVVYEKQGDYQKALEWHQKSLAIRKRFLGKDHPDTATTYNNIGLIYHKQEIYPEALKWYQRALDIVEQVLGKDHPSTATTYNNIAGVYDNQGDYPKAIEWYQKALAICEQVLGKDHPDTAITYNNIALVYDSQGDYPKALEWHQKALAIREHILGKEHRDTATTYNNIAVVFYNQGDYPKALEWYQKALAICEQVLGKSHPSTATTYNNIAGVYDNQGDYPKALEWYQKALAIKERVLGKSHPSTATTYNNIAGVYDNQGDYPKALEWYQKALAICEQVLGKDHPNTLMVQANMQRTKKLLEQ